MSSFKTDDEKLCILVKEMIIGMNIKDLAISSGLSVPSVYRYINTLRNEYGCTINNINCKYKIVNIDDDNVWKMAFKAI